MISYMKGKLVEKNMTSVVVENQGIGYDVNISLTTFEQLPDKEEVSLFTHLHIKEDSHSLYGFYTKTEREVFRQLISVSGIGTNTARTILSFITPQQVINAIASEDIETIKSVKGIGLKTAQRVVIDLKDKIHKVTVDSSGTEVIQNFTSNTKDEAISALEVLGYSRKQTEKVINKIIKENENCTVEQIIKQILKSI